MSLFDNTEYAFQVKSDQELKKAHLLFKLIGNEGLTKLGGKIFNIAPFLVSFPMVKPLIRKTIYSQFVGLSLIHI